MPDAQSSGPDAIFGAIPCHGIPWLCIWTGPNQERRAADYLHDQGIPVLAPIHEVRLPTRKIRREPLFRRYIFAQPDDGRIPGELRPNGITAVLRHPDGAPKIVPQTEIDKIIARHSQDGVIKVQKRSRMPVGQLARILEGAFTSFMGTVRIDDEDLVELTINIFGRDQNLKFEPWMVEAA